MSRLSQNIENVGSLTFRLSKMSILFVQHHNSFFNQLIAKFHTFVSWAKNNIFLH